MAEICIELDPETVATLEAEGDQIGVGSAAEYCQWLVEHRDAMPESPDRDHLLEAYRERFVDMKGELESAQAVPAEASESETADTEPPEQSEPEQPETPERPEPEPTQPATPETGSPAARTGEAKTDGGSPQVVANTDGGQPAPSPESSFELKGGPRTTVSSRPTEASGPSPAAVRAQREQAESEHTQSTLEDPESAFNSVNLKPERVKRIESDPVSEDATVLGSVETDRVDELSRRAVAKTRKKLKRDVETGLEYSSSTDISDESIRLGEDIVDIDHLLCPRPVRRDGRPATRGRGSGRCLPPGRAPCAKVGLRHRPLRGLSSWLRRSRQLVALRQGGPRAGRGHRRRERFPHLALHWVGQQKGKLSGLPFESQP
ncbi:MAG: hypothetical protein U5K37_01725 [Natrialbaceae archaeon]|nr:hypothetical protein [Natrialbaceae archaeon]